MIYFTIITCTYDASKYIDRTLESVQGQSYPHIEHFIIDGVSKDDTVKKAQTYAYDSHYPVIVKSEPDKGLYDAMNKGIQLAKGNYIIFLNAGDVFYEEDTLTNIAEQLKDKPLPGVIYGDTDIVDEEGNFIRKRRLAPPEKLSWKSFKQGMLVCHQSFYARTDIAKQVPYNLHYRYSADVDWCIRIMKEAEKQGLELWNTLIPRRRHDGKEPSGIFERKIHGYERPLRNAHYNNPAPMVRGACNYKKVIEY